MRVGVFGGTFDPVHLGHLVLAEQCREQARLDRVLFVPAARPPHKADRPLTPFPQRVEMLALAAAGNSAFAIDELERDRPGPSYTVDTLLELRLRLPDAELFLLLGSDSLADLGHWREPGRIAQLAGLLVAPRPGWPIDDARALAAGLGLPPEACSVQVIESPHVGISSEALRRRAAAGSSLRYQVPRAVECYIHAHHLYEEANQAGGQRPPA